jgi:probable HAF family extracellular repeat protein
MSRDDRTNDRIGCPGTRRNGLTGLFRGRGAGRPVRRERPVLRPQVERVEGRCLLSDYSITRLDPLPNGTSSYALGMNNATAGHPVQVVGYSLEGNTQRPVLWQNGGAPVDLGTLPGATYGEADAINDAGMVVGYSFTNTPNVRHAVLWQNGTITDLGTLPGDTESDAFFVSSSGQVLGASYAPNGPSHSFLWQNGVMTNLGTLLGQNASPGTINDSGQMAGSLTTSSGDYHAFLWQNGMMTDLGTLPGGSTSDGTLNNHGQVVGGSTTNVKNLGPLQTHAFLWQNGVMTDLGTLVTSKVPHTAQIISQAFGINDSGQVVGSSTISATEPWGTTHAFLWQNGVMTDLNSQIPGNSGWTLNNAFRINNSGMIMGDGVQGGSGFGYLLTPTGLAPRSPSLAPSGVTTSQAATPMAIVPLPGAAPATTSLALAPEPESAGPIGDGLVPRVLLSSAAARKRPWRPSLT